MIECRDTSLTTSGEVNTPMCKWRQGWLPGQRTVQATGPRLAAASGLMLFFCHTYSLHFLIRGFWIFILLCPENSVAGPGCEVCCSASKGPAFTTTGIHREDGSKSKLLLLKAGGEGDHRERDGGMASLIQWTWVWASSRRWWKTGKPGVLQSMGSQRGGHNWVTEQLLRQGPAL